MAAWIARGLRRLAHWLDGAPLVAVPRLDAAVLDTARTLAARAEGFAEGTSGDYKRAWVYGKLLKAHPATPKRALALALELSLPD